YHGYLTALLARSRRALYSGQGYPHIGGEVVRDLILSIAYLGIWYPFSLIKAEKSLNYATMEL
ncbi:hypothetical protein, partial [Thiolapillus sp.]|uniref:hypothetical protein n=1 Tax=Thiolapillus sp. TaxID=2017437 RepID=UPI003AF53ED6